MKKYIVGDKWIYYKIYTGYNTSDNILINPTFSLINKLFKEKLIDKWFFIRFDDPNPHIRLRIHSENTENIGLIINEVYKKYIKYLKKDEIWDINIETYIPEYNRYGLNTMGIVENLFFYESEMVLNFLRIHKLKSGDFKLIFCLVAIDFILKMFKYSKKEKLELFDFLKTSFSDEFEVNKIQKKKIDIKYRNSSTIIKSWMNYKIEDDELLYPFFRIIKTRNKKSLPYINKILNYEENKKLKINLNNLLISLIHMFINRLFFSKNREYELVIYTFLYKHYKTDLLKPN